MSESNGTPDWVQFYQHNVQPQQHAIFKDGASDQASYATAVAAATPPRAPPSSSGISPEGRVAKPARRRSRASRRTPTTVFSTDASNFRAMVQQFTGGGLTILPPAPAPPSLFSTSSGIGLLGIGHMGLQQLENHSNMRFGQVQSQEHYNLTSSNYGGGYQEFLGRVSLPHHSQGGSSSSSSGNDQNKSSEATNYML